MSSRAWCIRLSISENTHWAPPIGHLACRWLWRQSSEQELTFMDPETQGNDEHGTWQTWNSATFIFVTKQLHFIDVRYWKPIHAHRRLCILNTRSAYFFFIPLNPTSRCVWCPVSLECCSHSQSPSLKVLVRASLWWGQWEQRLWSQTL